MSRIRGTLATVAVLALAVLGACTPGTAGPSPTAPTQLVVMTHDSFAVSDGVLEAFEAEHAVDVQILTSGDAGSMVNQAILTKDNPVADLIYGVDNTFLSRALSADIFDPYAPGALSNVADELEAGTLGTVTPIDYGDVCVNYDKDAFASGNAPTSLEALGDPAYSGQLVVENPATSSPGLAFMLATIAQFGEEGWLDYWTGLRANDVEVVNDWETAYYSSFSGGAGEGSRPLVVSYATSPAAEVVFSDPPVTEAPTGVLTDGCFRQVEYAGVLRGGKAPSLARQFIDYMLTPDFQQDIPLNMFVFPATQVSLPQVFLDNSAAVPTPIQMDPALIAANRDRWVQEWTDAVIH